MGDAGGPGITPGGHDYGRSRAPIGQWIHMVGAWQAGGLQHSHNDIESLLEDVLWNYEAVNPLVLSAALDYSTWTADQENSWMVINKYYGDSAKRWR